MEEEKKWKGAGEEGSVVKIEPDQSIQLFEPEISQLSGQEHTS